MNGKTSVKSLCVMLGLFLGTDFLNLWCSTERINFILLKDIR